MTCIHCIGPSTREMNWRVQFGTRTDVVIAIMHGMCEYRTCTLILLPICSSSSALQSRSRNLIRALVDEILSRAGISSDLRQKQGPGQMFVVLPMPAFSMFVVLGRKNVRSELRCCPCRKGGLLDGPRSGYLLLLVGVPMTGNDRRAPLCHAARVQSFAPKVPMTGRARLSWHPVSRKTAEMTPKFAPKRPMTG